MTDDIRSKIKKISIKTKRLMQSTIAGDYLSAFKGSGLEFDQIREYQFGDDIRSIDWNSSAKTNKIMIKQFVEERDRTIILAIDISASNNYSSADELRSQTIAHAASILTYIATHNKDQVGALFFSDKVEKWIPPARGNVHCNLILQNLFSLKAENKKTKISEALRFLVSLKKRNAILFLLSDWIDETANYSKLLKVARYKFDFIGMRFLDHLESELPSFGLIDLVDPETNETYTIDTRQKERFLRARQIEQKRLFQKYKIDLLDLSGGDLNTLINQMTQFFHQRIRRQIR